MWVNDKEAYAEAGGLYMYTINGLPGTIRGDEWSIKIFNRSQNFTFARFARKI